MNNQNRKINLRMFMIQNKKLKELKSKLSNQFLIYKNFKNIPQNNQKLSIKELKNIILIKKIECKKFLMINLNL